jgi:hypothetical protein
MQRKQYVSDSLTSGLPGVLSATREAGCGGACRAGGRVAANFGRLNRLERHYHEREWERGSTMKDVSANTAHQPAKLSNQQVALHLCYGQIGISAVAAAARYQGGAKNPAYAPVASGPYNDEGAA